MTYTFNAVPSKNGRGRHRKPSTNVGQATVLSAIAVTITLGGNSVAHAQSSLSNLGSSLGHVNAAINDVDWEQASRDALEIAELYEAEETPPPATPAPAPAPRETVVISETIIPPEVTTSASVVRPAEGTFTSGFGPRWGRMHNGIDIANVEGTPIRAAMAGTVIDSGPASGFGNWIRIKHDDGSMTVYGHMSRLDVAVGQRVEAGDVIAGMGNLGWSTGPHLHFEYHPTGNGAVDPIPWFRSHGIEF